MQIDKNKIYTACGNIIEYGFYLMLFAVAFSNSIVEITAVAVISAWILRSIIGRDYKWVKLPPVIMLLAYLLWVVLSCFNSEYPGESFRGVFKAVEYSLLFLAMATFRWPGGSERRFVKVLSAAVGVFCLNGFYQYFSGTGLIRGRTLIRNDYLRRVSSSFVHPNDFGAWLIVALIVLISVLMVRRRRVYKALAAFLASITALTALYLTKSRGAWLSFTAGFLVLGGLKARKVLAVFVLLFALVAVFLPHSVQDRFSGMMDVKSGTTWERLMLWKGALKMIKERPFLGFGVNTYSRNFPDYKPPDYPDVRYSHNCYLHMASEIGVPGALFFISFVLTVLITAGRRLRRMRDKEARAVTAGLVAGLTAFALNSSVDTHLYSLTLAVYFHILMGFCYSLSRRSEKIE
ncbi:MAG: hypothetical protein GF408_02915 [Candidatus Omnitrophica bacterium]|nr:hypothetical protein [Candidatus Omnitrophota bacterium]